MTWKTCSQLNDDLVCQVEETGRGEIMEGASSKVRIGKFQNEVKPDEKSPSAKSEAL